MSALANDRFWQEFGKNLARLPFNRPPDPALSGPEIEEYSLSGSDSICLPLQRFFSPLPGTYGYIPH